MPRRYVALLGAVNIGGTGTLAVSDLIAACADLGFTRIKTHIASGNVVFTSRGSATAVRARLEQRLPKTVTAAPPGPREARPDDRLRVAATVPGIHIPGSHDAESQWVWIPGSRRRVRKAGPGMTDTSIFFLLMSWGARQRGRAPE